MTCKYVQRRYYIPSARTTSALYTFNPSASYSIASCSLQSMRYGHTQASLLDGNGAYINKRRDRVYGVRMPYYTVLGSSIVRTSSNPIKSVKQKGYGVYWCPFKCMQQSATKQGKKARLLGIYFVC